MLFENGLSQEKLVKYQIADRSVPLSSSIQSLGYSVSADYRDGNSGTRIRFSERNRPGAALRKSIFINQFLVKRA